MHFYIWTKSEKRKIRDQRILLARSRAGDANAMELLRRMGLIGYWHHGRTVCGTEEFDPRQRLRQG